MLLFPSVFTEINSFFPGHMREYSSERWSSRPFSLTSSLIFLPSLFLRAHLRFHKTFSFFWLSLQIFEKLKKYIWVASILQLSWIKVNSVTFSDAQETFNLDFTSSISVSKSCLIWQHCVDVLTLSVRVSASNLSALAILAWAALPICASCFIL